MCQVAEIYIIQLLKDKAANRLSQAFRRGVRGPQGNPHVNSLTLGSGKVHLTNG